MNDDNYIGVLLEEIRGQNKAVLEAVGGMQEKISTLATKEELQKVSDNVNIVKAAITDMSQQVHNQDSRISHLEAA